MDLFKSDEPNEEDQIDPLIELIGRIFIGGLVLGILVLVIIDTYLDLVTVRQLIP